MLRSVATVGWESNASRASSSSEQENTLNRLRYSSLTSHHRQSRFHVHAVLPHQPSGRPTAAVQAGTALKAYPLPCLPLAAAFSTTKVKYFDHKYETLADSPNQAALNMILGGKTFYLTHFPTDLSPHEVTSSPSTPISTLTRPHLPLLTVCVGVGITGHRGVIPRVHGVWQCATAHRSHTP